MLITRGANARGPSAPDADAGGIGLDLVAISEMMLSHKLAQDEKLLRQLDLE